jgi:hypothetical protein
LTKKTLSPLQLAALRRAASSPADAYIRAISAGDRVTFASLERRGLFERRAWRGDGVSRDSAFEYRLSEPLRKALDRKRLAS